MANPFDQFDNDPDAAPAKSSRKDMQFTPDKQGQIRILMQEWQTALAQPDHPRRDGDLNALKKELKALGVSVDAPQSTAAAPMVPVPVVGVDSAGIIRNAGGGRGFVNPPMASEVQPVAVAPRGAPRRGSLRALAQATPGEQQTFSPTAQAIESGVLSGATAGTDIYARAAIRASQTGKSFEQALAEVRAEQSAIREQYPVITGVGQAAGNIGLAALTGGSSLLPQMLATGAISGTQKYTESADSTLTDAAKAAALSAGLTGAAGGAVRLGSQLATKYGAGNVAKELDEISKLTDTKQARDRLAGLGMRGLKDEAPQAYARRIGGEYRSVKDVADIGELFGSRAAKKLVDDAAAAVKKDPSVHNKDILKFTKRLERKARVEEAGVKGAATQIAGREFKDILRNQATAGLVGAGGGGLGGLAYEYAMNRNDPNFDPYSAITSGAILGGTAVPLKLAAGKYLATRYVASPGAQQAVQGAKRVIPAMAPVVTSAMVRDGKIPVSANPFDEFDNDPDN